MSDRGKRYLAAAAILLGAAIGCAPADQAKTEPIPQQRVELTLVDRAGLDAVLADLKGQVVIVDCWATWCLPCVEQLPHTVELARQHNDAEFAAVTLSFDDSEADAQVRKLLDGTGATGANVTNLQSKFGGSSESMDAFEIASGALPHYKLYDRQGRLRRTFELDPTAKQQFTPADIGAAVAELLAE